MRKIYSLSNYITLFLRVINFSACLEIRLQLIKPRNLNYELENSTQTSSPN
jgi:hypothetical protein